MIALDDPVDRRAVGHGITELVLHRRRFGLALTCRDGRAWGIERDRSWYVRRPNLRRGAGQFASVVRSIRGGVDERPDRVGSALGVAEADADLTAHRGADATGWFRTRGVRSLDEPVHACAVGNRVTELIGNRVGTVRR